MSSELCCCFFGGRGAIDLEISGRKSGRNLRRGKTLQTCRKTSSSSATRKKKSEKGGRSQENAAQGAAAGKVQTMAPSRPALALPHPLSGQPIHSFMLFWQLSLEPGPIFFGSDKNTRDDLLATAAPRARAARKRPHESLKVEKRTVTLVVVVVWSSLLFFGR